MLTKLDQILSIIKKALIPAFTFIIMITCTFLIPWLVATPTGEMWEKDNLLNAIMPWQFKLLISGVCAILTLLLTREGKILAENHKNYIEARRVLGKCRDDSDRIRTISPGAQFGTKVLTKSMGTAISTGLGFIGLAFPIAKWTQDSTTVLIMLMINCVLIIFGGVLGAIETYQYYIGEGDLEGTYLHWATYHVEEVKQKKELKLKRKEERKAKRLKKKEERKAKRNEVKKDD